MRDEWSGEPGLFRVLDETRIAQIKAIYDLVTVGHGHLVTQRLTYWEPLADKVERTRFADGTEVVADCNVERLTVIETIVAVFEVITDQGGDHDGSTVNRAHSRRYAQCRNGPGRIRPGRTLEERPVPAESEGHPARSEDRDCRGHLHSRYLDGVGR